MKRSTDRFLTTHTGSLPRPDDLIQMMFAKESGVPVDSQALQARIRQAVAEVVALGTETQQHTSKQITAHKHKQANIQSNDCVTSSNVNYIWDSATGLREGNAVFEPHNNDNPNNYDNRVNNDNFNVNNPKILV